MSRISSENKIQSETETTGQGSETSESFSVKIYDNPSRELQNIENPFQLQQKGQNPIKSSYVENIESVASRVTHQARQQDEHPEYFEGNIICYAYETTCAEKSVVL